jgi:hypothetical protein
MWAILRRRAECTVEFGLVRDICFEMTPRSTEGAMQLLGIAFAGCIRMALMRCCSALFAFLLEIMDSYLLPRCMSFWTSIMNDVSFIAIELFCQS